MRGPTISRIQRLRAKARKDRLCNLMYDKTRWWLSILGLPEYILISQSTAGTSVFQYAPVVQSVSIIPVSPYTRYLLVLRPAEWQRWRETFFPTTTPPGPLCEIHFSCSIPYILIHKLKRTDE